MEFYAYDSSLVPVTGGAPVWVAYARLSSGVSYLPSAPQITERTRGVYDFVEDTTAQYAGIVDFGAGVVNRRQLYLGDGPYMAVMALAAAGGAPVAGLTLSWRDLYNVTAGRAAAGAEIPGFTDIGGGLYRFLPAAVAHEVGVIDLSATARPRYVGIDVIGTPPLATNVTTLSAIIAKMATVIAALTPTAAPIGALFERSPTGWPLRVWAKSAEGACLRKFEITRTGARQDLGVMDPAAAFVSKGVRVTIAYPAKLALDAGATELDALRDTMEADAALVRDALFSPGNLVATGHQASIVTVAPPDEGDPEVWYQDLDVTAKFYQSQTLT